MHMGDLPAAPAGVQEQTSAGFDATIQIGIALAISAKFSPHQVQTDQVTASRYRLVSVRKHVSSPLKPHERQLCSRGPLRDIQTPGSPDAEIYP